MAKWKNSIAVHGWREKSTLKLYCEDVNNPSMGILQNLTEIIISEQKSRIWFLYSMYETGKIKQ